MAQLRPALITCAASLALLAVYGAAAGPPVPRVHDEFAYLLTADTFAAGRLTNPTHPCWEHFDTFHVFHRPTYQAKYPPGQGAALALGQVLFGEPAWGVWIALAAGLGAVAWMLTAVLPPAWAALGPLLWLANAFVFLRWGQSYWGGGVALGGGALLGGGLLWSWRLRRAAPLWAAGLGIALLASSRPAEGALVCLLVLPAWAWSMRGAGVGAGRLALPLLASVVVTLGWTALYDHALTGDAWTLPHQHWDKYVSVRADVQHYAGSVDLALGAKLLRLERFYFGDVLVFALPLALLQRDRLRLVVGAAALVGTLFLVSALGSRAWPHYLAPLAPWVVLLLVLGLRQLATLRFGRLAAAVVVATHVGLGVAALAGELRVGAPRLWSRQRAALERDLLDAGGEHLVLVRYPEGHFVHEEWIYNAAEIDAAPVVWARDLGPRANRALLEHFRGRRVWSLEARGAASRLEPALAGETDGGGS